MRRLREAYRRWRVRRRRRKLLYAYAKVARIRYGLGPGFSPLMFAYDRVTSEGLADIVEGPEAEEPRLDWDWPEEAARGEA